MPSRLLTLFGEELIPEALLGAPKLTSKDVQSAGKGLNSMSTSAADSTPGMLADWVSDKQYYTIGEVAHLFAVRSSHIRFWTNEFELKVRTTRKGDRLYTLADIATLRAIYHLVKERGFTIPGAKAQLKGEKTSSSQTLDLRQALLQLRNQLISIRNEIL